MKRLFIVIILLSSCVYSGAACADLCVTDKCHGKIGREKYVHGPVAAGECVVCHEKTGEHKFKPITNVKSLCSKCHDRKTNLHGSHKSIADDYRECCNCHDAHQSSRPLMLLVRKAAPGQSGNPPQLDRR